MYSIFQKNYTKKLSVSRNPLGGDNHGGFVPLSPYFFIASGPFIQFMDLNSAEFKHPTQFYRKLFH